MKVKIWNKLLLVLGAVLVLLIGAGVIFAVSTDVVVYSVTKIAGKTVKGAWVNYALLGCGVYLVVYGLYAMLFPRKMRYNKHGFVVQKTENGDLRISVKAIESLVKRCMDMHEEINLEKMRILSGKKGVAVELRISLANNISIPLAVASLQKQIKQYLLASSGIEVSRVSVTVETTAGGAKKGSPYMVAETPAQTVAAAVPVQEAAEEPKEKKPMHQRIFASKNEEAKAKEAPVAEVKQETETEEKPAEAAETLETAVEETDVQIEEPVQESVQGAQG